MNEINGTNLCGKFKDPNNFAALTTSSGETS